MSYLRELNQLRTPYNKKGNIFLNGLVPQTNNPTEWASKSGTASEGVEIGDCVRWSRIVSTGIELQPEYTNSVNTVCFPTLSVKRKMCTMAKLYLVKEQNVFCALEKTGQDSSMPLEQRWFGL